MFANAVLPEAPMIKKLAVEAVRDFPVKREKFREFPLTQSQKRYEGPFSAR